MAVLGRLGVNLGLCRAVVRPSGTLKQPNGHPKSRPIGRVDVPELQCAQNTMLASRVALANMIYDACQEHGIEYEILKELAFDCDYNSRYV